MEWHVSTDLVHLIAEAHSPNDRPIRIHARWGHEWFRVFCKTARIDEGVFTNSSHLKLEGGIFMSICRRQAYVITAVVVEAFKAKTDGPREQEWLLCASRRCVFAMDLLSGTLDCGRKRVRWARS